MLSSPAERARIMWEMKQVNADDLPQIAMELLETYEDPHLLQLSIGPVDRTEAVSLFERFLASLHLEPLSEPEILRQYVILVATDIVNGRLKPVVGAKKIWHAVIETGYKGHDYDTFGYAASEYDDRPADQHFFQAEIMKEAMRWTT